MTKSAIAEGVVHKVSVDMKKALKADNEKVTFETFFSKAKLNFNAQLITGVICGYRIEELYFKNMKRIYSLALSLTLFFSVHAQTKWVNLDSLYQPLPSSVHLFKSNELLDGKPNIMYYAIIDLKDKGLKFTADTSNKRRLTPDQYYQKNNHPLLVVNCSFFSFATNRNQNVVIKDGKMVSYNHESVAVKGNGVHTYFHSFSGAIGISKRRKADVAWVFTDSTKKYAYASQSPVDFIHDSSQNLRLAGIKNKMKERPEATTFSKWKMQTAVGGGPVLLQDGEIRITNNEERRFSGKAINNPEPRTAMGYTKDNKLVILVCEGRSDSAAGLSLIQLATVLKELGCTEAVNLDGGGSSCMLLNGKETNTPSSKGMQRPVPSVFLIERK